MLNKILVVAASAVMLTSAAQGKEQPPIPDRHSPHVSCGGGKRAAAALKTETDGKRASMTNCEILEDFLDLINRQHRVREAFEKYVVADYIQHNFALENGREGAIRLIEGLVATPGFDPEIKHFVVDGDMIAQHMYLRFGDSLPALAVMDLWRFENGKIVEHWDVMQPIPPGKAGTAPSKPAS